MGVEGCRLTRRRVNLVTAKEFAKVKSLLDGQIGKVLLAEGYDLALGYEARELTLTGAAQLAQLDATDLSANGRSEVGDLSALRKELGVRRVGILAGIVVLERLQRRVLLLGIPSREVVLILA